MLEHTEALPLHLSPGFIRSLWGFLFLLTVNSLQGRNWSQPMAVPELKSGCGQVGNTWSVAWRKRLAGQAMAGMSQPLYSQTPGIRLIRRPDGQENQARWGEEMLLR